jgi:hypothetical protein
MPQSLISNFNAFKRDRKKSFKHIAFTFAREATMLNTLKEAVAIKRAI